MVCRGGERMRGATQAEAEVVEMGTVRKLHNFNLPFLKWGSQKQLRCMKLPADSGNGAAADRGRRSNRSPQRSYEEEGIEEVREKIMMDFKTAADRLKHELFRKSQERVSRQDDDDEEEEEDENGEEESQLKSRSPPLRTSAAAEKEKGKEDESRPWNLRTRRAACKAPATGIGVKLVTSGNSNSSPGKGESAKSPRVLRVVGEKREREEKDKEKEKEKAKEKERAKFTVGLSRKQIEEDFMEMVGHRPARRPKKRPRTVQKQIDTLFPGLWLTEVTADMYSVPEVPDTAKR